MSDKPNASRPGANTADTFPDEEAILERLRERFGAAITASGRHAGQSFAVVARDDLLDVLEYLKTDASLRFDFLSDVTVVDHHHLEIPQIEERFAVVYSLTSIEHGHRFRIKTAVAEDDPEVPTASALWKAALWGEREAHDMFGIVFAGNPDLRRLLMPADYDGFPLRKDYPLRGHGERDRFVKLRRGESPESPESPGELDAEGTQS